MGRKRRNNRNSRNRRRNRPNPRSLINRNVDPTYGKTATQFVKVRDNVITFAGLTGYFFQGGLNYLNLASAISSSSDFVQYSDSFQLAQFLGFSVSLTRIAAENTYPTIYLTFFPSERNQSLQTRALNSETAQIVPSHFYGTNTRTYKIKPLQAPASVSETDSVFLNPAIPIPTSAFGLLPGCLTVTNPGNITFGAAVTMYQVDIVAQIRFLCPK